jgi:hypothetical protein
MSYAGRKKGFFLSYIDSLLSTDENTHNAFFLNFFIMKKNTSIRIETESSDVDGYSCEEESVSTSDSIIEQLKNALKKKKSVEKEAK